MTGIDCLIFMVLLPQKWNWKNVQELSFFVMRLLIVQMLFHFEWWTLPPFFLYMWVCGEGVPPELIHFDIGRYYFEKLKQQINQGRVST